MRRNATIIVLVVLGIALIAGVKYYTQPNYSQFVVGNSPTVLFVYSDPYGGPT